MVYHPFLQPYSIHVTFRFSVNRRLKFEQRMAVDLNLKKCSYDEVLSIG